MTAKLTKTCRACKKRKSLADFGINRQSRDGHNARCKPCVSKRRSELRVENMGEILAHDADDHLLRVRSVAMLYCPDDPELHRPMYIAPCLFSRGGFQETLAAGYWPDGSLFEYAVKYRSKPTRWRSSGRYLLEEGTDRVAIGVMQTDDHVSVRLLKPMTKGEMR